MAEKYYDAASEKDIFDRWVKAANEAHKEFRLTRNKEVNWTPLAKPLDECKVALVSTGGVHRKDQRPFDVKAYQGDRSIRVIPANTPGEMLMVTHSHYNHRDADKDINCLFPIDRLRELAEEGFVGDVAQTHYGMMGFIPNGRLVREILAPEIAKRLMEQGVNIVVLSPG